MLGELQQAAELLGYAIGAAILVVLGGLGGRASKSKQAPDGSLIRGMLREELGRIVGSEHAVEDSDVEDTAEHRTRAETGSLPAIVREQVNDCLAPISDEIHEIKVLARRNAKAVGDVRVQVRVLSDAHLRVTERQDEHSQRLDAAEVAAESMIAPLVLDVGE